MRIGNGSFTFDPFESTTVINGTVQGNSLQGTLSRPGGNRQILSISFTGHAEAKSDGEQTITGALVSGACSWQVSLRRA